MAKRKKEISEFGNYLEQMIKETGMYKSDFYAAVGIKKPYFYEILAGSPPPQDTLETMIGVIEKELGPDEKRRRKFYDLAAKCRQEIPSDMPQTNWHIKEHSARDYGSNLIRMIFRDLRIL